MSSKGPTEKTSGKWQWLKQEMKINKDMLPTKAAIFMYVGGVTAFLPYLTLHMQEIGLSIEEIAIIYAVLPIAAFIGPMITGILADKFGRYTTILSLNILLTAVLHTLLLIVPPNAYNGLQFTCNSSGHALIWNRCDNNFTTQIQSSMTLLKNCKYLCDNPPETVKICLSNSLHNDTQCLELLDVTHEMLLATNLSEISLPNCNFSTWTNVAFEGSLYNKLTCPNECPLSCHIHDTQYDMNKLPSNTNNLTFAIYFVLRLFGSMTLSSCFAMLDAVVLAKMKQSGGGDFGKQRTMSMVGQSIAPLLAGVLVDKFSPSMVDVDYSAAFYLGDVLLVLTVVVLSMMNLEVDVADESIGKNVVKLLSKVEIDVFLFLITYLGMNWGFLETYLFVYLKELNAPTSLLGLTLTVGCASGVPMLFFADYFVEKIGRSNVFVISFVSYFIRFVGYSYIWDPWMCFPFEILEVFTYQIMWVAAATYCPILAPKGLLATMTGIAGAVHYSLGRGLGSFLGGYLISMYGTRATFRGLAYASLVGAVLHLLAHHCFLKQKIALREKDLKEEEIESLEETNRNMELVAMMANTHRRSSVGM